MYQRVTTKELQIAILADVQTDYSSVNNPAKLSKKTKPPAGERAASEQRFVPLSILGRLKARSRKKAIRKGFCPLADSRNGKLSNGWAVWRSFASPRFRSTGFARRRIKTCL